MITNRQKQILSYIKKFIKEKEYSPSYDEIRKHFRLVSKTGVQQHIEALIGKGFLSKIDGKARSLELTEKKSPETVAMYLRGIVSAGEPIEAIDDPELITVPKSMIGGGGDFFALKIEGNSMIEKGITDKDIVIIKEQPTVENGEIVLAIIDDDNATIKIFQKRGKKVLLKPANRRYKTKEYGTKEIKVQGKVVGVLRKF